MPMIPTDISTCLTWTPDGELASEDHHDIMARLAAVDPLGEYLCSCELSAAGPPSTVCLPRSA